MFLTGIRYYISEGCRSKNSPSSCRFAVVSSCLDHDDSCNCFGSTSELHIFVSLDFEIRSI